MSLKLFRVRNVSVTTVTFFTFGVALYSILTCKPEQQRAISLRGLKNRAHVLFAQHLFL